MLRRSCGGLAGVHAEAGGIVLRPPSALWEGVPKTQRVDAKARLSHGGLVFSFRSNKGEGPD